MRNVPNRLLDLRISGVGVRGSPERARTELADRLRARRVEIEQTVLTRVYGIAEASKSVDPAYLDGLRAAVSAGLDYGLEGIESGEEQAPPTPTTLLAQARLAARNGISLDTVLRRYFAGYALLGDFLIEEANRTGLGGDTLKHILRDQATVFDRLLASVTDEHAREAEHRPSTADRRRAERIERLLGGELINTTELAYSFEGHHLAAIARGSRVLELTREIGAGLDCRSLIAQPDDQIAWAWFGGRRPVDPAELKAIAASQWPEAAVLAIGEPGEGLSGWRLSHHQAAAAVAVAIRGPECIVRYSDVALLAAILHDDVFAASLRRIYLDPLDQERDGGASARQTLRAYFATGRNVSSTAARLGVSRRTVTSRLHRIEEHLGRPLDSASVEINAALRLDALDAMPPALRTN
jgi:PucR-like helix-turn-helix protein/diguanylate cyclase with GGDEF domain